MQQLEEVGLQVTVVYEAAPSGTTLDVGAVLRVAPPEARSGPSTTVVIKVVDPDKG